MKNPVAYHQIIICLTSALALMPLLAIAESSRRQIPEYIVPPHLTHGPMLGNLSSTDVRVWGRSNRPTAMTVRYGVAPNRLDRYSDVVHTMASTDNTTWLTLSDLSPNTRYHYAIEIDGIIGAHARGSFKTLPDSVATANRFNPDGHFNFSFATTSCAKQSDWSAQGVVPYRTMLNEHSAKVDFALQLGDWLYEEDRDWPVDKWREYSLPPGEKVPDIVLYAPNLVGVWENYKTYLDGNYFLAEWHRNVPSLFAFDDHEVLNNFSNASVVGSRRRDSLFRDIGLQGWIDYLAWSNPTQWDAKILFGRTKLEAGNDILFDPNADFEAREFDKESTLHVHWGGRLAGVRFDLENKSEVDKTIDALGPEDPNAGVYRVVEVIDQHRIRVSPTPKADSNSGYSIGIRHYYNVAVSNTEFFVLDARSYRVETGAGHNKRSEMLGRSQLSWLKRAMRESRADILFVVSPAGLTVPHLESIHPGSTDSSWTGFVQERNELFEFWDELGKTVIVISGDMHNSYSIRLTERLWEFGAGPIGSLNRENTELTGSRPANGEFISAGTPVEIRWSTFFNSGTPREYRKAPVYAVFQINSVYDGVVDGEERSIAFPKPQVVVSFIDAMTGDLLYAESVVAAR